MNRNARVALSQETLAIIEHGEYRNARGNVVSVRSEIDRAVAASELYREVDFPDELLPPRGDRATALESTDETTLDAVARLLREQSGEDIFVLNFASAKNPGGGFLNGSQAQEESLARSSALYPCLMAHFAMYEFNRGRDSCLYSDWMIYAPRVPIFRDDAGNLLDTPHCASFLTSPAVNAGAVRQNSPEQVGQIDAVNRERARKLLWVAARKGHRTLVLGAWGCGVFRNDPRMVAAMFADLLRGEFAGCFERVVMAVYDRTADRGVHRAFVECFG